MDQNSKVTYTIAQKGRLCNAIYDCHQPAVKFRLHKAAPDSEEWMVSGICRSHLWLYGEDKLRGALKKLSEKYKLSKDLTQDEFEVFFIMLS